MAGYRALELGADALLIGLLAASFALPAVAAALPAGRWSDQRGGSTVALAGLAFGAVGIAVAITAGSVVWLVVGSVVIGLGHLLVMVGQQSFVAHVAQEHDSDGAFGTLTAAASVGQLLGPLVVTAAAALAPDDLQARAGLLACLLCSILASLTVRALRRHDPRAVGTVSAPRQSSRSMVRRPGVGRALVVGAAVIAAVDLLYSFLPLWAEEQRVALWQVGALLSLRAIVSILSRIGLTPLVLRFGRRRLLLVALVIGVVAFAALPLVGASGGVFVMVGLGIALGLPQPITMSWITRLTSADAHGAVLGLRMTANRVAQVAFPLIVGVAAGPTGSAGFATIAVLLGGAAVVTATSGPESLPPGNRRTDQPH